MVRLLSIIISFIHYIVILLLSSSLGEVTVSTYTCAYTDGSTYNIKVKCDGWNSNTLKTSCPKRKRTPTCSVMTNYGKCTVNSYTNTMVECYCDICATNTNRRSLSSAAAVTQVSTKTNYKFDDYVRYYNNYYYCYYYYCYRHYYHYYQHITRGNLIYYMG